MKTYLITFLTQNDNIQKVYIDAPNEIKAQQIFDHDYEYYSIIDVEEIEN